MMTCQVSSESFAAKAPCTADEILETLNALEAADTLHEVPLIPFHPHALEGKLKGSFLGLD